MDWIKRNYDQFILALVALGLLALSAMLISNALDFQAVFAGIRGNVVQNSNVPPVDMSGVQSASDALQNPGRWQVKEDEGSIFVSIPYVVSGSTLENPLTGPSLHPPVPNKWIIGHGLDILDNNVLNEDADGDGFTNLDEWKNLKGDGSDSTDPQDPKSHPPYYTKLRLIQYIKKPFRLLFNVYNGDPKNPASLSFQINTIDVHQASQFVGIGDTIAGTKFKVIKFEFKEADNPSTGIKSDVSELTVENTETHDDVVLVLGKVGDSPDSYAWFRYLWDNTQFAVKKNTDFPLKPDANSKYKLIDIKESEALIQTPTGEKVRVPRL